MSLLGFIRKQDRTNQQHDHHAKCEATFHPALNLPVGQLQTGQAIRLFDAWRNPLVVKDVGFIFPRFHQLTGSCVGAGGGQALYSLIATQRLLNQNATKAFIPFWPYDYGKCRQNEGDRGQGEGALGSSFAETVMKNGVLDAATQNLPAFTNQDGLILTEQLEMQWSDGASQLVSAWDQTAIKNPVKSAAVCRNIGDVRAGIMNGYPCTFACDRYIGNASVQNGVLMGFWDGNGGHQQSVHAYWEHAQFGPLYWAQNNWPKESYPANPDDTCPDCGCWVTEAHVAQAFRLDAEVYALSHLEWIAAQPDVLNWVM